jgi:hypothetical protein
MSRTLTYREQQARDHMRLKDALMAAQADPAKALANLKARHRTRQRNMLDPQWHNNRRFPPFFTGMTTAQYVAHYQNLNGYDIGHRNRDCKVEPLAFLHADRAAPEEQP